MKINVEVDELLKEISVLIKTPHLSAEVTELISKLETPKLLIGFTGESATVIDENKLVRVYANSKRVFAVTEDGEYLLKIPVYSALERLDQNRFLRISQSEIINFKKVVEFDLSFSGTVCVKLSNGDVCFVSRRYVSKIKHILGLGGR